MNNINDPHILYLIVNETLNMSPGKIAAQVGHATEMMCEHNYQTVCRAKDKDDTTAQDISFIYTYYQWKTTSNRRKVVLKANQKEWNKIKQEYAGSYILVVDAGYTEIEAGSETVIALYPMLKSQANKTLKRLQLL